MAYDRTPAPGDLRLVETFCNSAMFLRGLDAFTDLTDANGWLREHRSRWNSDAAKTEIGPPELAMLVRAREAIRDHLDPASTSDSAAVLNELASSTLAPPGWGADGRPRVEPRVRDGIDGLIGRLLAIVFTAGMTRKLDRLKACQSADCRWLFYDRSPSRRAVWCSMDTCGSRHKMRAYRSRRDTRTH